jgi:SAM-dependent methyltransferase
MSFGAVAGDYDRLRPTAPPAAVEWLLPDRREVVVDLAAGTGLLSRALAGRAGHVIAVEPDARMRAVLQERSPGVEVLAGVAEAIPLPDASADAVLVSSAWHWMDPELAVPEIARVLLDGGRFGVTWNSRDRSVPWIRAAEWFRTGDGADASEPDSTNSGRPADAARAWEGRGGLVPGQAPFVNIETASFSFSRTMTVPDIADMLATYSRVITAGPEVATAGRARAAAALAEQFPGATELDVPMRSRCWRADRAARTGR